MAKKERHIIIIRLSALGDVAIAAPLIREYAIKNKKIKFSIISQPKLEPFFAGIDNITFIPYKKSKLDLISNFKFAHSLLKLKPTEVADFHNVLRSKIIRNYLNLHGIPFESIDKNRDNKRKLIRKNNKILVPLKTSLRLYEEVLIRLGLKDLNFANTPVVTAPKGKYQYRRIGIAPFAMHKGKCWPLEYMEKVISELSKDPNIKIILFGGKGKESELLELLAKRYNNTESVAGKYTLEEELEFIKSLDVMVSMDSANMHFASFVNTPVISIWGATHPYAGFYGWGQNPNNAIQTNLPCRPCSIFGDKECLRGDYACMRNIMPEEVLKKIYELL
jgi:ADP-heptose:LPS heptosyltransferase